MILFPWLAYIYEFATTYNFIINITNRVGGKVNWVVTTFDRLRFLLEFIT